MKSRNELLNELNISLNRVNTFSCPEFDNVYSKAYFREMVEPSLKSEKNPYAFIFGDFNKLGIINDVYGHDFGDSALRLALKIIKKEIPSDATLVRAGGDEIFIVLPNADKDTANEYCEKIHDALQRKAFLIGGLSITLASSDSNHGSIDKLVNITDNEVTNIKAARKEDNSPADILSDDFIQLDIPDSISNEEKQSWDELNHRLNISIYEFLQNFRPSKNFKFNKKQITDSSNFIINSFLTLLKEDSSIELPEKILKLINEDYPKFPEYKNVKRNSFSHLSLDEINTIKPLLCKDSKDATIEKLSDEDLVNAKASLDLLLEQLVRDNTGLLDKQYFRHSLAQNICESAEDYSASYFTFPGIKLSNFAYDHTFSDNRMKKTNSILCENAEKSLNFNNKSFDFSPEDIYLLSQGGGNYLCLYPKKMQEDIKPKIQGIADSINSNYDYKDPNSSFSTACYSMSNSQTIPKSGPTEVVKYVRALKEETNFQKVALKKNLFKSSDAYFAFKKSIDNCIKYYINNIPDATTDINKIVLFIKNVYTSFLNQEVLHNETREDKMTSGLNFNNFDFEK